MYETPLYWEKWAAGLLKTELESSSIMKDLGTVALVADLLTVVRPLPREIVVESPETSNAQAVTANKAFRLPIVVESRGGTLLRAARLLIEI